MPKKSKPSNPISHDKSSKEAESKPVEIKTSVPTDEISKEQLMEELKAGFTETFRKLISDLLKYEDKHDFESKASTCRFALYLAEDFENKETLDKYELIFKAIVYAIAWSNRWITD